MALHIDFMVMIKARRAAAVKRMDDAQREIQACDTLIDLEQGKQFVVPAKTANTSLAQNQEPTSKTDWILGAVKNAGAAGTTVEEINALLKDRVKRQYLHTVLFKLKERELVEKKQDRYFFKGSTEGQQQALLQ
jgi:hypothetical protein